MKLPTPNLHRRGFTLVEVMIAIAIALLLIVAIGQIFGIAQRTTSAGTALLGMNATARSALTTFNEDFHDMVTEPTESPGLVIASYPIAAYFDKPDADSDIDGDPQTQNDPAHPGQSLSNKDVASQPLATNSRIHRVDRFGFFARSIFHRQTAGAPNFVSPTTSSEAFIWYGHLTLPNNPAISAWDPDNPTALKAGAAGFWFNPGANKTSAYPSAVNDNNRFASQWILGRQVILLLPNTNAGTELGYPAGIGTYPLSLLSVPTTLGNDGSLPLYASRYDLSFTPMSFCRSRYMPLPKSGDTAWWENLMGLSVGPPAAIPNSLFNQGIATDQRYYANPYPTKPNSDPYVSDRDYRGRWHSAAAAQTAPIFIRGCTQFIVEYTGNYVTQNQDINDVNFGRVTALAPDPSGKIDFIPVKDPLGRWTRHIRWYGFPRDVNGTDSGTGRTVLGQPDGHFDGNDVMPLGMFMQNQASLYGLGPVPQVAFERATMQAPMASIGTDTIPFGVEQDNLPPSAVPYICAWGPDFVNIPAGANAVTALPKMIRITIATGDANGRLNTDRYYEYVFTLP